MFNLAFSCKNILKQKKNIIFISNSLFLLVFNIDNCINAIAVVTVKFFKVYVVGSGADFVVGVGFDISEW